MPFFVCVNGMLSEAFIGPCTAATKSLYCEASILVFGYTFSNILRSQLSIVFWWWCIWPFVELPSIWPIEVLVWLKCSFPRVSVCHIVYSYPFRVACCEVCLHTFAKRPSLEDITASPARSCYSRFANLVNAIPTCWHIC